MIWTERWKAIGQLAAEQRATLERRLQAEVAIPDAGEALPQDAPRIPPLLRAGLEAQDLDVFPLPPGDPLLGGARAVFGGAFVAYDAGLPLPAIAFSLAHELGHTLLHGEEARCSAADIDEDAAGAWLEPPPAVETYSPRQQRELEANAFAAAFLMPPAEVRAAWLVGAGYTTLAARYGVSETAMLNALAATLLVPTANNPSAGHVGQSPALDGATPPDPAIQNPKSKIQNSPDPAIQHSKLKTQNFALDPSQQAAAAVAAGPVLIDAGPGTGKTRTLVERVGALLGRGVAPGNILALTFSNRAANEMRERLRGTAADAAGVITVGTFHAFCLGLLQEHGAEAGLPHGVRLIDDVQAAAWLETRLVDMRLEHYTTLAHPARSLPDILDAISRARDELVDAAGYARLADAAATAAAPADDEAREQAARWAEVARVYAVYERLLESKGALDFGGLLLKTVELLRAQPQLLAPLQRRYTEILVDEYQDMNRASAVLLQLLAGDGHGLWVVGDLRQAIYRFRGASPANINQFESDFPGGRRLRLGVNYRSDPALVDLFGTVGGAMALPGAAPDWQAERPAQPEPHVWLAEAADGAAEARGIAAEIRRRHTAGRPYRDQVVLCRTHGQAAGLLPALEAAGVPVLYLGNLFERPEVRDLLALIALAAEGDGSALLRAVHLTEHAVDRAAAALLIDHAHNAGVRFPQALGVAAEAGLGAGAVAACDALGALIAEAGPYRDAGAFLARALFGPASPLRPLLAQGDARAAGQIMALGQLLALARSFAEISRFAGPTPAGEAPPAPEGAPLRGFLVHVRRLYAAKEGLGRVPQGAEDLDAVRILTIHASKGLEFPVVYVPGLADRRFPFREMWEPCPPPPGLILGESAHDHALEERCLFFVAISRARDELVLSRAERYGKLRAKPSPFLDMIAPFRERHIVQPLHWPATPAEDAAPPPAPGDAATRTLDVAELEAYLHCPRQYEYSWRFHLSESDEQTGYLRFHSVVRRVLADLRADQAAGTLPTGESAVLERLTAVWTASGPVEHVHEAVYAAAARRLVLATWRRLSTTAPRPPWAGEFSLALGGATVTARLDLAQQGPEGLRLVRTRVGKPRDDDRKAPRLALLRAAAQQTLGPATPVTVALEYLESGSTVEVPDAGRYERDRLAKLEGAVHGIRAGHFPPTPDAADNCLGCPFWIICPC